VWLHSGSYAEMKNVAIIFCNINLDRSNQAGWESVNFIEDRK